MNPALPLDVFIPDSEARQWADGRLYVYGSLDVSGDSAYCSRDYRVFSSEDLVHWTDHGVSFTTHESLDEPWGEATLYAPDCVRYRDEYRLFFCTSDNGEGVARSSDPAGPFGDPHPIVGAHADAIDPAAFIDDDGTPYLFWGQFNARGARLRDDLTAIDPETFNPSLVNEAEHGFHEGASVRKRNGVYYLVYADISHGRPTALGYATADSPLGPYTKRGIIVDNIGCDPETWNNHGSIAEVDGRWYVFYHRSSQNSRYNRRLCIEPIEFTADGSIPEVPMTTGGVEGPLAPGRFMDASRACLVHGGLFAAPVRAPELADASASPAVAPDGPHEVLTHITDESAACYRYYDFAEETRFSCLVSSATYGGTIEVRIDAPDGDLLGSCTVPRTGDWARFVRIACDVRPILGVHELWLVFRAGSGRSPGRLLDVLGFWFA